MVIGSARRDHCGKLTTLELNKYHAQIEPEERRKVPQQLEVDDPKTHPLTTFQAGPHKVAATMPDQESVPPAYHRIFNTFTD